MRYLIFSLIFIVTMMLTACNDDEQTIDPEQNVENSEEDVSASETDSEPENMNENQNEVNETEEEAEEIVEDEEEEEGQSSDSLPGAAEILQQSFEAMTGLTGVYIESIIDVYEEMGGEIYEEERKFNTVMLLEEPFSQRMRLVITNDLDEPVTSEVYKVDGKHYIYRSFDDAWLWIDDPQGTPRQLSPLITEDTLENHLTYSDRFEVTETEEDYLLTFSGTYDEFMSSMFGGVQEMLTEIERERPPNLEDVINSFSILIDKETYYVRKYDLYYEGMAPESSGEYFVNTKGYVLLGNYNQYDEIEVPEEIIEEAVSGE